jgi:tRNA 2-selenouridine synthase
MTKTISIQEVLELDKNQIVIVDTRSPKEFEEDNIPGSISIPLFSNEERAIIGTLYKENQVKAYEQGIEIYNKKITDFIEQYKIISPEKKMIIYCWRGGMRSKTITDLVSNIREDVSQLIGGYKNFRKIVRDELNNYKPLFKLIVLQGLAGCGKTDIIKNIEPSIDLEGFAKHRSSLFGSLGLKPCSQKMFESRLWEKLNSLKNEKLVFIEGEAKKIGDIFVPTKLFQVMEESTTVEITSSMESRTKRIVRDYFTHQEDEKIKNILIKLKAFLSNNTVEELIKQIDEKNYLEVAKVLLEDHYDKQYTHALKNQNYEYKVNSDNIEEAVKELKQLFV